MAGEYDSLIGHLGTLELTRVESFLRGKGETILRRLIYSKWQDGVCVPTYQPTVDDLTILLNEVLDE